MTQLDPGHRPRAAGSWSLFGQVAVFIAAGVGTYQAASGTVARDGWAGVVSPALLSPVLLGLAAGQVAVWLVRGSAALMAMRTGQGARVASYLAVRRLARRADSAFATRVVVAAGVVAAITASAATDVSGWQDETTRLSLGGPTSYRVDAGPMAAYLASQQADPDGRWLMAMTQVPDKSEAYRRMFADTSRWDSVVGDFYRGTAAGDVGDHIDAFAAGPEFQSSTASKASVTFVAATLQRNYDVRATLVYRTTNGVAGSVEFRVRRPKVDDALANGRSTIVVNRPVPDCAAGCIITELDIYGVGPEFRATLLEISGVMFGDVDLLASNPFTGSRITKARGGAEQRGSSIFASLTYFGVVSELTPESAASTLTALVTPGLRVARDGKGPIGYSVDGAERAVDVVGEVDGVPLLGGEGMMLDLPRAMTSGTLVIPSSTSYVVARADTPAGVLETLESGGVVSDRTGFDEALAAARSDESAQGIRLYLVMSVCAGLIALIGAASAVVGQRPERRREAAGLRVVGVRSAEVSRALWVEAWWLAAASFAAITVIGWWGS